MPKIFGSPEIGSSGADKRVAVGQEEIRLVIDHVRPFDRDSDTAFGPRFVGVAQPGYAVERCVINDSSRAQFVQGLRGRQRPVRVAERRQVHIGAVFVGGVDASVELRQIGGGFVGPAVEPASTMEMSALSGGS